MSDEVAIVLIPFAGFGLILGLLVAYAGFTESEVGYGTFKIPKPARPERAMWFGLVVTVVSVVALVLIVVLVLVPDPDNGVTAQIPDSQKEAAAEEEEDGEEEAAEAAAAALLVARDQIDDAETLVGEAESRAEAAETAIEAAETALGDAQTHAVKMSDPTNPDPVPEASKTFADTRTAREEVEKARAESEAATEAANNAQIEAESVRAGLDVLGMDDRADPLRSEIEGILERATSALDRANMAGGTADNLDDDIDRLNKQVTDELEDCRTAQCLFDRARDFELEGSYLSALAHYDEVRDCADSTDATRSICLGVNVSASSGEVALVEMRVGLDDLAHSARSRMAIIQSVFPAAEEIGLDLVTSIRVLVAKVNLLFPIAGSGVEQMEAESALLLLFEQAWEQREPLTARAHQRLSEDVVLTAEDAEIPKDELYRRVEPGDRLFFLGRHEIHMQWAEVVVELIVVEPFVRIGWVNLRLVDATDPPLLGSQDLNDAVLDSLP